MKKKGEYSLIPDFCLECFQPLKQAVCKCGKSYKPVRAGKMDSKMDRTEFGRTGRSSRY